MERDQRQKAFGFSSHRKSQAHSARKGSALFIPLLASAAKPLPTLVGGVEALVRDIKA